MILLDILLNIVWKMDVINYMADNGSNKFSTNLEQNLTLIKKSFIVPTNKDLNIRNIYIKSLKCDGALVFIDVMVDSKIIEKEIIDPLLSVVTLHSGGDDLSKLEKEVLTVKELERLSSLDDITSSILKGNTILLVQGISECLSLSTTGFEHRAVEKPTNENVLKGPKEAFVESAKTNISLVRRQVKYETLITENLSVGKKEIDTVYMMYIDDVVDKDIVNDVKNRLAKIDSEFIQNLSMLEQYIEERSYSLIPTVLYTERPDRASSFLHEGHIILIMNNSPSCLVVPVTFFAFFHTGEDQYERWSYGNFIRLIRVFSFFIALMVPALYVAITNFHQEMIPTDLVLAISGTRETLPFPAVIEVLLMELSFELIREAGTRIPTSIGPTIGIVGALILGQAAVEANIVSPILVIVVALTGLSSFAIPDISFSYMIRITRFILILFAVTFGFLGISTFLAMMIAHLVSINSFGVPFLSPLAPHYRSSKDLIVRAPVWKQWVRPFNLHPKDKTKNKKPKG